jgi:hypothetical protein
MQGQDGSDESCDAGGRAPRLAEESPGLEGRGGLPDQGPDLGVGPVDDLLTSGKRFPVSPVRDADRAPGTAVSLVGPARDAGVRESTDDAVFTGGPDVVDGTGRSRRGPQQPSDGGTSRPEAGGGSASICTFIPCFLCLPEWKGRSAAMRSMGSRVPSSSTNAFVDAVRAAS